ncbi:hypothetical protein PILCRDRAFT_75372, partial [Piloderma croceum F 1598]
LEIVEWEDMFVSVYSQNNARLLFSMCGLEVQILPKIGMMRGRQFLLKDAVWNLTDEQMKGHTPRVFLHVSGFTDTRLIGVQQFNNRILEALDQLY